jgi:hypothetical protein
MEEKENVFKCPNDIKVTIIKDKGETVLDEECCTNLSILLKNTGDIATSFFGAHSPAMIKVLEKTMKKYFKSLKKTLKEEYKRKDNEEIVVHKGDSEINSPEIEEALKHEVDVDVKYEIDSLKDIDENVAAKSKKIKTSSQVSDVKKSHKKNLRNSKQQKGK